MKVDISSPAGDATSDPTPLLSRETLAKAGLSTLDSATLLWGLPTDWDQKVCRKLVESLASGALSATRQKQVRQQVDAWLRQEASEAGTMWEGLVWLRQLPTIAALLDDSTLQRLAERFFALVQQGADNAWDDDPWRFQLLTVEYPAVLAAYLAKSPERTELKELAQRSLLQLSEEWLDGEGMPEGRQLSAMRPILASWTRCLAADNPAAETLHTREALESFVWLLRQTLRLTRCDGTAAFSQATSHTGFVSCLEAAVRIANDAEASLLFQRLVHGTEKRRREPKLSVPMPEPSVYSEWGEVATMRSRLDRQSPQLTIAFDEAFPRLELVAEQPLLQGIWNADLRVDGERLMPTTSWDEVCWHHDDDAAYLELETKFAGGWRLQRQILLARQEGFVLLADTILGDRSAALEYSASIPLAQGIAFQPEAETHEAWLAGRSRKWLVMPLGLPEWRSDRPLGSLSAKDNQLTITSQQQGQNLFVPLLIPLNGSRGKLDYTWRRLTVAQQLEIQPPDVAVAYRAQVGDRQWAIYRALRERGNRTFLGKNLATEFFVGLFHRTGQMDTIMEVE
jgi:hypothetical protein